MAGKTSVVASARTRILRMEGTPEARHNSLRPVAGWLRLTDGLELPCQSIFGSAADHCSGRAHREAFGPFVTEPAVVRRREVASAGEAEYGRTKKPVSLSTLPTARHLTAGCRMPATPWHSRGQPNQHVAGHAVEITARRIVLRFMRQHHRRASCPPALETDWLAGMHWASGDLALR